MTDRLDKIPTHELIKHLRIPMDTEARTEFIAEALARILEWIWGKGWTKP